MRKVIAPNGKIGKDAKEAVQAFVSEFIAFVTREASGKCRKEKQEAITGDHLLWAMATLGFQDYIQPLKLYLQKYRGEGASEDDIRQIPRYKFRTMDETEKNSVSLTGSSGGIMIECGTNQPIEKVLAAEDAECCICLSAYDDGVDLRELPCGHHFHCACIDKWLHINATCPLCKLNVRKNSSSSGSEEV